MADSSANISRVCRRTWPFFSSPDLCTLQNIVRNFLGKRVYTKNSLVSDSMSALVIDMAQQQFKESETYILLRKDGQAVRLGKLMHQRHAILARRTHVPLSQAQP